jgi:hypothetical protein
MPSTNLYPITFNFSTLKGYQLHSLVEVAKEPNLTVFDSHLERSLFEIVADEVYIPLLKTLDTTETHATIIITGNFLTLAELHCPALIELLIKMIRAKKIKIVANAYYGNSLTSLYHSHWWAQSVEATVDKVTQILGIKVDGIYLEQLFRGLELERVTHLSEIFLARHKAPKYNYLSLSLSELRKFDGHVVSWITPENDVNCTINYVPNNLYFDIDNTFFSSNRQFEAKSLALKAAAADSRLKIRRSTPWLPLPLTNPLRITEKYSLVLYTPMERAVIRLWEYGAYLIASIYHNRPDKASQLMFENFSKLQDAKYLRFLKKQTYKTHDLLVFSSPYEAFVHMQTMIKLLEMSLQT